MKLKVEQDSTLKNCKFEDLNSTDEEKHPSEFTYVEAQNQAQGIIEEKNTQELDLNNRVLGETKAQEESPIKNNECSSTLTSTMKRRVKKQGKYSSLETLSMRMLKQKGVYSESKALAKINEVGEQKNYCIIALRLGFLYHYETTKMGIHKQKSIQWMYEFLEQNLEKCINQKYLNNNSEAFVQEIKNKNMKDLNVFKKALQLGFQNFETLNEKMQELYEKKSNGCPSLKNQKFCQKVTHVLMGTALYGSNFRLNCFPKEIDLLDEIQFPNKKEDKIIQLEKYHEELMLEDFYQFDGLDVCRQKGADGELFDLTFAQNMNSLSRRQSQTMANLQYFSTNVLLMD